MRIRVRSSPSRIAKRSDAMEIIDTLAKVVSTLVSVCTLYLAWTRILPRLDQIHTQTNSLAAKAEAGARALGVMEGIAQQVERQQHE